MSKISEKRRGKAQIFSLSQNLDVILRFLALFYSFTLSQTSPAPCVLMDKRGFKEDLRIEYGFRDKMLSKGLILRKD